MPVPLERASLLAQAQAILSKPGAFSKEDSAKVEGLLALADSLTDDDAKNELRKAKLKKYARETGREEPVFATRQPEETGATPERLAAAADQQFLAYLRTGGLPERRVGSDPRSPIRGALSEGTGSAGGVLVPQPFADRFETMLQQYDELFSIATLFSTSTGDPTGFPIVDDVSSSASIVAENANSSVVEIAAFGKLGFPQCPTFRSHQVVSSLELASDSHFDLTGLVAGAFAVRFARGIGSYFVGILLEAAALGVTAASATAIAPDEIFELIDSLDPAYIAGGSFLMAHSTYTSIMRLKGSGSGDYLFKPIFDGAGRPTLCGYPVYFSPSMPAIGASAQSVAFGDLSKFLRREVAGSLKVHTYKELFAASGAIGWEGFWRVDGGLLLSGSQIPVNYLIQAA